MYEGHALVAALQSVNKAHDLHHSWQEHKNCTGLFSDIYVADEIIQKLEIYRTFIQPPDVCVHKLGVPCKSLRVVELVESFVLDLLIVSPTLSQQLPLLSCASSTATP